MGAKGPFRVPDINIPFAVRTKKHFYSMKIIPKLASDYKQFSKPFLDSKRIRISKKFKME